MKTYIVLFVHALGYSSERWVPVELELDYSPYTRDGIAKLKSTCADHVNKTYPVKRFPEDIIIGAITEIQNELVSNTYQETVSSHGGLPVIEEWRLPEKDR